MELHIGHAMLGKASKEVVVFGASGYSGLELLRILAGHPAVSVAAVSSDRFAGDLVADHVPIWQNDLRFSAHEAVKSTVVDRPEAISLLATPVKTSIELTPVLLARGISVIDLSGAFRLEQGSQYSSWYGFEHPRPDLLEIAEYGLFEFFPVQPLAGKPGPRLVANPGCYATAAILATAPMLQADMVEVDKTVILDGKSGASGAGRALEENLLFCEVADSVSPYRVACHQHTPEMERALSILAKRPVLLSFTPHLVPMPRGLLVSAYLPVKRGIEQGDVDRAMSSAYAAQPFVRVVKNRPPATGRLTSTNCCEVGSTLDARTRTLVSFAAIDNLVKGAAGQAVQNLNSLLGLPHTTGLLFKEGHV